MGDGTYPVLHCKCTHNYYVTLYEINYKRTLFGIYERNVSLAA